MDEQPEGLLPEEFDDEEPVFRLPIEWHIPDTVAPRHATNVVVQQLEHEFVISFFELIPPIILGSPEEQEQQVRNLKAVRATCVARIVVSANRMPGFVNALQNGLDRLQDGLDEGETDE